LYTTPAVESKLHSGAFGQTYKDAWNVHTILSGMDESQRMLMYVDAPGKEPPTGEYVIIDASLRFNATAVDARMATALKHAEAFVLNLQYESESKSAIIVAFTTLFIATVTIPQHWNEAIQRRVYSILAAIPALLKHKGARVAYVGLCRFLASTIVVGPAMFSFLIVVARDQGLRIADGYPSISYQAYIGHPHCVNARLIGEAGFGVAETVVLETNVQTWAVAIVCSLSLIALLAATILSMFAAGTAASLPGSHAAEGSPGTGAALVTQFGSSSADHGGVSLEGSGSLRHEGKVLSTPSSLGYGAALNSIRNRTRDVGHKDASVPSLGIALVRDAV
jgi:hypothetical protein